MALALDSTDEHALFRDLFRATDDPPAAETSAKAPAVTEATFLLERAPCETMCCEHACDRGGRMQPGDLCLAIAFCNGAYEETLYRHPECALAIQYERAIRVHGALKDIPGVKDCGKGAAKTLEKCYDAAVAKADADFEKYLRFYVRKEEPSAEEDGDAALEADAAKHEHRATSPPPKRGKTPKKKSTATSASASASASTEAQAQRAAAAAVEAKEERSLAKAAARDARATARDSKSAIAGGGGVAASASASSAATRPNKRKRKAFEDAAKKMDEMKRESPAA